jgi:hypothetical protein
MFSGRNLNNAGLTCENLNRFRSNCMAGRSPQRKAKRKWSQETIRRRGLRAVVAGLRLKKEHQELSCSCAACLKETAALRAKMKRVASRTKTLAKIAKRQMAKNGFREKTAAAWNQRSCTVCA